MQDVTEVQIAERVAARLLGLGDHCAVILAVLNQPDGVELRLQITERFSNIHGPGNLVLFRNDKFGFVSDRIGDWFYVKRMSNVEWLHDSATVGDLVVFFHSATEKKVKGDMLNRIVRQK